MDTLGVAQIAEPKSWQVAEITKAALRGEDGEFELVFVEIGFSGDFEWAAVMFCATDDYERGFDRLIFRFDVEAREFVIEDFARTLPPVSEDTHFGFEFEIDGISDAAVGTGASDAEKIPGYFRFLRRSCEAEGDLAASSTHQPLAGLGEVPGKL